MIDTAVLRHQHEELLELAGTLSALLTPDGAARECERMRALLDALGRSLELHLALEDTDLYAPLLNSLDPAVQRFSREFHDEMDILVEAFESYEHRWPTATAIRRDPIGFVAHSKRILPVLAQRFERENARLYPIADAQ